MEGLHIENSRTNLSCLIWKIKREKNHQAKDEIDNNFPGMTKQSIEIQIMYSWHELCAHKVVSKMFMATSSHI